VNERLAELCIAVGIEGAYVGIDGLTHIVPDQTLIALADALDAESAATAPPPTIAEVLANPPAKGCFVLTRLENARIWGMTCQLPGLVSARNLGIGDFADLAALCEIVAAEGADFVGVNPLHALFWSDPRRISPFFPSNRRFLNPLYIALDRVDGFAALPEAERTVPTTLRDAPLLDLPLVVREKDRRLRRLFAQFPWTAATRAQYHAFREAGGEALGTHALFEAVSQIMVADGFGATPPSWPAEMQKRTSSSIEGFSAAHRDLIDYHLWLQWQARVQLGDVQKIARAAGLRVGLYVDLAVGAAPDGSAAWGAPELTLPDVSVGAPPDPFSVFGQDWGLAPLSPTRLAALDAGPLADIIAAAAKGSGALRIDHAMGLARMWLIPRGFPATDGAYVRYPLRCVLERLAEVSHAQETLVIGEDLGVVPEGFRQLMSDNNIHSYKVLLTERDAGGFADPKEWPVDALACFATHDMPTFAGWWRGTDLAVRRDLGLLSAAEFEAACVYRTEEKKMLGERLDTWDGNEGPSVGVHAAIASSPCRLAILQIEDALGVIEQANIPGTTLEHPNWRRRLPVALEDLAGNASFHAHTAAMRSARPK
jgi:4-alpha-glucanotransferase